MDQIITDRLPLLSEGDKNGEVMAYTSPTEPLPLPVDAIDNERMLNPETRVYIGWRRITNEDYANQ